jgi:hypothetical protein
MPAHDPELPQAARDARARGGRIEAIRTVRRVCGVDLRTALRMLAAETSGGQGAIGAPGIPADLQLPRAAIEALDTGDLIAAIRAVREAHPGLGLKEAKDVVERVRSTSRARAGHPPTIVAGDKPGAGFVRWLLVALGVLGAAWWAWGGGLPGR